MAGGRLESETSTTVDENLSTFEGNQVPERTGRFTQLCRFFSLSECLITTLSFELKQMFF